MPVKKYICFGVLDHVSLSKTIIQYIKNATLLFHNTGKNRKREMRDTH